MNKYTPLSPLVVSRQPAPRKWSSTELFPRLVVPSAMHFCLGFSKNPDSRSQFFSGNPPNPTVASTLCARHHRSRRLPRSRLHRRLPRLECCGECLDQHLRCRAVSIHWRRRRSRHQALRSIRVRSQRPEPESTRTVFRVQRQGGVRRYLHSKESTGLT